MIEKIKDAMDEDARVAEIVEPNKPKRIPPGVPTSSRAWRDMVVDGKLEHCPRPFISAPTHATDGIVLEWVQGQGIDYDDRDFYVCLASLVSPEGKEIPLELLAYVRNYKPGMYAHALLAVEEERDDS